jgi:uncharacterized phage protein (TIGR01671 family)
MGGLEVREIKYRAWEKSLKQMIPVDNIDFEKRMINTESAWRMFDEIELMQYTGEKDKNGKEIYEGDIIRTQEGYTQQVFWNDSNQGWDCLDIDGETKGEAGYLIDDTDEVIGNIYENPELIGGQTN